MKKYLVLILLLIACGSNAQKLKGSKIVTITQKEIGEFQNLEVGDNLEVFLIKGDKCGLEIEADDNLHDAIGIQLSAGTLRLGAAQEVTGAKKFSVKVTYTSELVMVTSKGTSNVTALNEMDLDNLTFKTFDSSRLFATAKTKKFTLMSDDKSKVELNLTAEDATIELSKSSNVKALIASGELTFDMYQKSVANIEGDVIGLKLRLDNNAAFTGKNLTSKNAQIATDGYSNGSIMVSVKAVIEASGKSEIHLYGDPIIELMKFADSAILMKKPLTGKVL